MSLVLTGFSVDELERFALCAPPEMAEAARQELEARGPVALAEVEDDGLEMFAEES